MEQFKEAWGKEGGEEEEETAGDDFVTDFATYRRAHAPKPKKDNRKLPKAGDAKWGDSDVLSALLPKSRLGDIKLYCDTSSNKRWQVYWTTWDKTRSFGFSKHGGVEQAAYAALREAWRVEVRAGGEACPFEFVD